MATGIQASPDLTGAWHTFENSDQFYFKVEITPEHNAFVVVASGGPDGDASANWAAIQAGLQAKKPCYVFARAGSSSKQPFVPIFFCPSDSKVRDRMVYAGSFKALKSALGSGKFTKDYHITVKEECSAAGWADATRVATGEDIMTSDEVERKQAAFESGMMSSRGRHQALKDLPLAVHQSAIDGLGKVASGAANTAIFFLDPSTEELTLESASKMQIDNLPNSLPNTEGNYEPRYILHAFEHQHESKTKTENLVIYFCPDKAVPRLKMQYSHSLKPFAALCAQKGNEVKKRIETGSPSEITHTAIMDELYPKVIVRKTFAKPTARGGKRKLHGGVKFSARR